MRLAAAVIGFLLFTTSQVATAKPPVEAFGEALAVRNVELSETGRLVGFLNRFGETDHVVVYDFATGESRSLLALENVRARDLRFVGDKYLVVVASKLAELRSYRGRWEHSIAYSIDLESGKALPLLRGTERLYPAQEGLGRIVAVDDDGEHVYMPAFRGDQTNTPSYDVIKVNLRSGRGLTSGDIPGQDNTHDWIVDGDGKVLAREDYDERNRLHEIRVYDGRRSNAIYSKQTDIPEVALTGVSASGDKLMLVGAGGSEFLSLYELDVNDGSISGPVLQRDDADIEGVVIDENRVVLGVQYSGMRPTYEMFDPEITSAIASVQEAIPNASVFLSSWSQDFSKLLFYVTGGLAPERYYVFDRTTAQFTQIAAARPEITEADVGEVMTIEYKSTDGLTIPAVVTWPTGVSEDAREGLPLVVLPHGGPESYDFVQFDWLAQYLANEGYLVLQPNFRGSAGLGSSFRLAGHGQWGRMMQEDIDAGARALATIGWADPERTCIVGWSYGGYAALAAGALNPSQYKCVASIAGVSDLIDMLEQDRKQFGPDSLVYTYWKQLIGDPATDKAAIEAISPYKLAQNFVAPVLLIHGDEDTVVPVRQSRRMENALKDAGKEVTYLKINGDDHSLVANESRVQALSALGSFLRQHIAP